MNRMMGFIGATAGGWAGYGIGTSLSTVGGLVLALIGTAVGVYIAGRLASSWP
ncbi:MAG: hypothetical protein KY397_04145 [Gemmatimonadetes bacterium]|nr:hypothetical protein [Gemmatimonadota bacterium]